MPPLRVISWTPHNIWFVQSATAGILGFAAVWDQSLATQTSRLSYHENLNTRWRRGSSFSMRPASTHAGWIFALHVSMLQQTHLTTIRSGGNQRQYIRCNNLWRPEYLLLLAMSAATVRHTSELLIVCDNGPLSCRICRFDGVFIPTYMPWSAACLMMDGG